MSQRNVDALRQCFDAFNRPDISGMLGVMDPEIRFECQFAPVQGCFVGYDGVREFFTDMLRCWRTDGSTVRTSGISESG